SCIKLDATPGADVHEESLLVRAYFAERFEVSALAGTTDPILDVAKEYEVPSESVESLTDWVEAAQGVTFARDGSIDAEESWTLGRRSLVRLVGEFESRARKRLLAGLVGLLSFGAVSGEPLADAEIYFQTGKEAAMVDPARAQRLFLLAAEQYEVLVADPSVPENGPLYYNLGNTYFLAGDLGKSILNYRRAELYWPGDNRLEEALNHVRAQRVDAFPLAWLSPRVKQIFFWHYLWGGKERLLIVAVALGVAWILAIIRLFSRGAWIHHGWVLCGVVALVMLSSSWMRARQWDRDQGVILAAEVTARKGDGKIYEAAFSNPIHAGAEVDVVETRREWSLVKMEDGNEGWIPTEAVELVLR
ncbi:MAG: hypothetical protein AAF191_21120, partial [Verrucomicrobiota bacterium]